MPLAQGIVIEIMGWRDLYAACAKGWVNIVIGNDRQRSADQGQLQCFSNQMSLALIFRIYRNGNIAQHGLGPCGGNNQALTAIGKWIVN